MMNRRNKDPLSDEELLCSYLKTGDPDFFGTLYNRYIPLLYGLCLKYLKSPEDAEDAVMQLFEDLLARVKRYDIDHFKSWLYRVAQNYCLQVLRQKSIIIHVDIFTQQTDSFEFLNLLGENGDEEQLNALHHCMARLSDAQRICIHEFFLADKSYAEISEQTGYHLKGVKSHIQNGKRNLKLCIEKSTTETGYCHI